MKIGNWGGIDVYIHWTFWLLIAFYLVSVTGDHGLVAGLLAVGFVFCVFACVALHEFGHAAAAARFGIRTRDITLLPIGGVARLERLPEKPVQELVIALAGPAVNFVIAAVLLPVAMWTYYLGAPATGTEQLGYLEQLLAANLILALFNLLPAFPMDGGRVLRSLLAMRMGHLRATEIAARGGRWMALLFGLIGLVYFQFGLMLLAGFIFLAGTAELMAARVRSMGQAMQGSGFAGTQAGFGGWQMHRWPAHQAPLGGQWTNHEWTSGSRADDDSVIDATEVRQLSTEPLPSDQPPRLY